MLETAFPLAPFIYEDGFIETRDVRRALTNVNFSHRAQDVKNDAAILRRASLQETRDIFRFSW